MGKKPNIKARIISTENVKPIPEKQPLQSIKKGKPEDANIYNTIQIETQLYRVRQDIGRFRLGILNAENVQRPQRYSLLQTYADAMLDSHLSACVENRINFSLSRIHQFLNPDGSVNEELTKKILATKWFRDFCRYALESRIYGYSVVMFGDVTENGFTSTTLIPRQYVKPEFHLVTDSYSSFTGNDYTADPFCWWNMGIGDEKDLGLLKQASIHAIYKKNAIGAWAEFAEVFGVPIRIGTTNLDDPKARQNMENWLKNMGVSSYGLKGLQDKIEIISANRSDASKVFLDMIQLNNDEISKLILGATGVMDEKSHVGAAKVHMAIADNIKMSDAHLLENYVNNNLKKILEYHGFPVSNLEYKISDSEDIDLEIKAKMDLGLLQTGRYIIPAEYIEKTYGTPVEIVAQPEPPKGGGNSFDPKNILNELSWLYPKM